MGKGLPRSLARASAQKSVIKKMQLRVDHSVTVTAVSTAVGFGSVVLSGLPEGQIKMIGAACRLDFAGPTSADLSDTWNGDFGIGTTPASDATITGADVDIIASTALGPAVAEVAPTVNAINGTDAVFDNTAADLEVNLNVLVDAADIVDDSAVVLSVTGVVEITYIMLLDD